MSHVKVTIVVIGLLIIAGCAQQKSTQFASNGESPMRIEILGFDDCPNTPEFEKRIRSAVEQSGVNATVVYVDQESLPRTDLRRGYPTPTALVDGRDLYGMPAPDNATMGCRMYPDGVPNVEDMIRRIVAAHR